MHRYSSSESVPFDSFGAGKGDADRSWDPRGVRPQRLREWRNARLEFAALEQSGSEADAEPDFRDRRIERRGGQLGRDRLERLAPNDDGDDLRRRPLEMRCGCGSAMFGDRFAVTPDIGLGLAEAGRDYSLGWRLTRTGAAGVPDRGAPARKRQPRLGERHRLRYVARERLQADDAVLKQ